MFQFNLNLCFKELSMKIRNKNIEIIQFCYRFEKAGKLLKKND